MTDKPTTGIPGPLTPDRNAVPSPTGATTRDVPAAPLHPNHPHTNSAEGLTTPETEAHAPGRTTDGATNNP